MSQPEGSHSHSHDQASAFARYGTARRYTTITLRELQFYGHCDCCPDPRFPNRRHVSPVRDAVGASTYIYHARPTLVPRSDSEESVQSEDSSQTRTQSNTSLPGYSASTSSNNQFTNSSNNSSSSSATSAVVSATAMPVRSTRTSSTATTSTISSINSRSSTSSPLSWLRRKPTSAS